MWYSIFGFILASLVFVFISILLRLSELSYCGDIFKLSLSSLPIFIKYELWLFVDAYNLRYCELIFKNDWELFIVNPDVSDVNPAPVIDDKKLVKLGNLFPPPVPVLYIGILLVNS